jgi:capsular polysaccharide biosynthesis protein
MILHILLKRKIQIVVFPLAAFCTIAISTFAIIPNYRLKTHILVTVDRDICAVPALGCGIPVISSNHKAQISSKIVILKGRSLIQDVVTFLNPATIHPDLDAKKAAF